MFLWPGTAVYGQPQHFYLAMCIYLCLAIYYIHKHIRSPSGYLPVRVAL